MVAVPIPYSKSTVSKGLGTLPASVEGEALLFGTCVGGVAGTVYSYRGGDAQAIKDDLVRGPLVRAGVRQMLDSDGKTTHLMKVAATTAGSSSAVTASGGGPTVTVTGATPTDSAQVVIRVITGGAVATATVQISYDGGDTFGDVLATAATITSETGETINFAVGTYVAGETYSYINTAPALTSGDISAAIDAYIAKANLDPEFVRPVGFPVDAASAATISVLLNSKNATAEAANKYPIWCQDMPPVDKALINTALANVVGDWWIPFGGFCEMVNIDNGRVEKASQVTAMLPRLSRNPASVDGSRKIDDSDLEPLPGILKLVPEGAAASTGYHDEAASPGFAVAGVSCALHFNGLGGFYGNYLSKPANTDLELVVDKRVMRKAQRGMYRWQLTKLNKRIRAKRDGSGQVNDIMGDALCDAAEAFLGVWLDGDVEDTGSIKVVIVPTNALLTQKIIFRIAIQKNIYARAIESVMAFAASIVEAA